MSNHESSDIQDRRDRSFASDVAAVAVLAAVLAFFYWGFLTGRHFIWDDTLNEFYPGVNYFAKSIQAGRFPLWFPGVRDGMPFYSDPQMAVFYPPQWLLIPFVRGGRLPFLVYQRYIFLHYVFGGLFMYGFLKQIKLRPVAALIGALAFCLSGFASLHIVNFVVVQTYIWLPLQLLCVYRLTAGGSRWAWLGLVGAMLMSLLAGHQQTLVYGWYLVIAYWLYRGWSTREKDDVRWTMKIGHIATKELPKMIGTFALVLGLGAVVLLPALENWRQTSRARQPFEIVADTSLPYHQLLTLLVPNFFGETQPGSPVQFWGFDPQSYTVAHNPPPTGEPGFWQYWEFGVYSGQIFWLALFLLLFNWRRIGPPSSVRFFAATWLAAIWFMLGRYGGLFQLLYHVLPGASLFRGPAKMSCVADVAAATLIACSIDLWQRNAAKLRCWPVLLPAASCAGLALVLVLGRNHLGVDLTSAAKVNWSRQETLDAWWTALALAIAAVGVARSRTRWIRTGCLCGMVVVCVIDFDHAYGAFHHGRSNPDIYYTKTDPFLQAVNEYRQQHGPFRCAELFHGRISEESATPRNLPYFYDYLEVPEGYTSFYLNSLSRFQQITNETAIIAIQNVKLVLQADADGHVVWMGELPKSFPRARFFSRIKRYGSESALLAALANGEINWLDEAAVGESPAAGALPGDQPNQAPGSDDEVQFTSLTPERYSITYRVSWPGIIFVSQAFYPGWVPTDQRFELVKVFGAFQGIVIPEAGRGQVTVRFSPPILKWGMAITMISIAMTAWVALGKWGARSKDD